MTEYSGKTFLSIADACKATGLSQTYLRSGCKSGQIPHIMAGAKYLINLPLLLAKLNEESQG